MKNNSLLLCSWVLSFLLLISMSMVGGCSDFFNDDASLALRAEESIKEQWDKADPGKQRMYYRAGMVPGTGFDSLSGEIKPYANCLQDSHIKKIITRNTSDVTVSVLHSWKDLEDLLYFSGYVKFMLGTPAGPVSIAAEVEFGNYMKKNSENIFILVSIQAEIADYIYENPRLIGSDTARGQNIRSYYESEYDKFKSLCGDSYLHTITTGGRYLGIVEIETKNKYHKMRIGLEAEITYIPLQVTLTGGLKIFLEELSRKYELKFHVEAFEKLYRNFRKTMFVFYFSPEKDIL